jgi:hypothetical protein
MTNDPTWYGPDSERARAQRIADLQEDMMFHVDELNLCLEKLDGVEGRGPFDSFTWVELLALRRGIFKLVPNKYFPTK